MSKKKQDIKHSSINKKRTLEQTTKHNLSVMREIRISSPIPPPEIMKEYNALMPDAMQKFFSLAEKQSNHRQEIEKLEVINQNKRANIGLWAGWSTTILLALLGAWLLYNDKKIGAYTFFISAILPRIISFVVARHDRRKQLEAHK